jgi:hypothetical protein
MRGTGEGYAVIVTVDGRPLNPRLDLWNHSPSGIRMGLLRQRPGATGAGAFCRPLGDDEQALNLYQRFKWAVIVELPRKCWTLTSRDIDQLLKNVLEAELEGVA